MNQFFHMSLYGRRPRKGAKPHETITGIAAEAARLPGACPHVKDPQKPTLIYGVSPLDAAMTANERAERARDAVGKRLRCDGAALAACVASYPLQTAKVKDDAEAMATYLAWQGDVVAWLQVEFSGTLMSVVAHWDEEYPHLHAYVVPELGPDLRLRWDDAHPGRRARAEAIARSASSQEVNAAYLAAMRALQDRFHDQVSRHYGHLRLGPRRRRVERAVAVVDAKARKAEEARQAMAQARLQDETIKLREEYAARFRELENKAAAVIAAVEERARRDRELAWAAQAEAERLQALLVEQEAALARLHELLRENGLCAAFSI